MQLEINRIYKGEKYVKEEKIRVLMIEPHKYPQEHILKNDLNSMQEAVGGLIDIIGLEENVCVLLNDDGKLIGLDGNRRLWNGDIIAGTFYVCGSDNEGNLTSLNDEQIERYSQMFFEPQEFRKEEVEETIRIDFFSF